ncbi:RNA-guided endonuclease InsQ/TnpB family protein [Clostridium kluyveri]|uniref:RNA-guided endonuclease InsQ/TnpB family protein n=1 Tax=Clostridium kluyveri TaxID=1534 RepID=UPI00241D8F00|nr:transposase [Clostridium kluyveri]
MQCYPTREQINQLEHDSFWCKILYNTYLSQRKEIYDYSNKSIKMSEQRNQIIKLREDNSEYAKIYAKHLHAVCMDLEEDYKGCIKKRARGEKCKLPRYKDKNYWYPLKTPKQYVKIKDGTIKLGFYELKMDINKIPKNYGEIWITKTRDKYILSITYELDKKQNQNENILAVDLGISKLITATNQNGEILEIINPRYDKYWNKKLDQIRSMRDKKKKDSRRYKKLTQRLNKTYSKRKKQQEHFLHSVTKHIIEDNKTIVIGNLSQEKMIKNSEIKKFNRSIKENWGLGKFKTYLTYKAKLHDVEIVKINEAYTSKICSNCGNKHDMPLSNRVYKCECGMSIDRDINSAINIFNRYKENEQFTYKNINKVTTLYFRNGKLVA